MQYHRSSAFFIFLGSYFPLAIILALQDIPLTWWARPLCSIESYRVSGCDFIPFAHPALAIIVIFVTALAMVMSCAALNRIRYPFRVTVSQPKSIPNEIINYTFPYVVSFMGISYGETQKLIGLGVFLLWMFIITYESGQILMNPLLLVFKWRLYEGTVNINGVAKEVSILKKGTLSTGTVFEAQTIQGFYILKE